MGDLRRTSEVAALTGIERTTLARWARRGWVTAEKRGKLWYIDVQDARRVSRTLKPGRGGAGAGGPGVTHARRLERAGGLPAGYVTIREAHQVTGVPRRTIRRWADEKRVRSVRRGGMWYVCLQDVKEQR